MRIKISDLSFYPALQPLGDLTALKENIRKHGQLNPIQVEALIHNKFAVISGEKRVRAMIELGYTTVEAEVH